MKYMYWIIKEIKRFKFLYFIIFLEAIFLNLIILNGSFIYSKLALSKVELEGYNNLKNSYKISVLIDDPMEEIKISGSIVNKLKTDTEYSYYYCSIGTKIISNNIDGDQTVQIIKVSKNFKEFYNMQYNPINNEDNNNKIIIGKDIKKIVNSNDIGNISGMFNSKSTIYNLLKITNLNRYIMLEDDKAYDLFNGIYCITDESYKDVVANITKVVGDQGKVRVIKLEDELLSNKNIFNQKFIFTLYLSIFILLGSLFMFISLILSIISKSQREIGISISMGATKFTVFRDFVSPIILIYIISFIIVQIPYILICIISENMVPFPFIAMVDLFILVTIILFLYIVFKKISNSDPIKFIKNI